MDCSYVKFSSVSEVTKTNFSKLAASTFWSKGSEKELGIHRIHAYPAKFPAFITTKALSFAKFQGVKVNRIGDVFCGCGTVAFEARRNGINFWGCDINPVATLIAKVKSSAYDPAKLERYHAKIVADLARSSKTFELSERALDRLDYWYTKKRFRDLARLRNAIQKNTPPGGRYRRFFLCAFSNILKPTSRWLTKSIKPQLDPLKRPSDVARTFSQQVHAMIEASKKAGLRERSQVEILTANMLDVRPTSKVDMIVTSPPYVTSYEYADLHQLSSLWLGFASDYRSLRKGSIGSTQHNLNFNRDIKHLNKTGARIVFSLFDRDEAIARSTAKYFLDMQAVAQRCFGLIRRSGIALFVIGNTEYKNVRVDNASHLAEALLASGFRSVQAAKRRMTGKILTPYRDSFGQFSGRRTGRHVYAEEFILIATK
jgi:methylase of polypeptide subunit release factors